MCQRWNWCYFVLWRMWKLDHCGFSMQTGGSNLATNLHHPPMMMEISRGHNFGVAWAIIARYFEVFRGGRPVSANRSQCRRAFQSLSWNAAGGFMFLQVALYRNTCQHTWEIRENIWGHLIRELDQFMSAFLGVEAWSKQLCYVFPCFCSFHIYYSEGWWTTNKYLVTPLGRALDLEAEQREKSDLEQRQVGFHCVAPLQGWLKIVHGIKSFDDPPSKFGA